MRLRANYSVHKVTSTVIWLIDADDGSTTITNNAEAVVLDVVARYGNLRIIYRDTMGRWDELVHANGRFIDFKPSTDPDAPPSGLNEHERERLREDRSHPFYF